MKRSREADDGSRTRDLRLGNHRTSRAIPVSTPYGWIGWHAERVGRCRKPVDAPCPAPLPVNYCIVVSRSGRAPKRRLLCSGSDTQLRLPHVARSGRFAVDRCGSRMRKAISARRSKVIWDAVLTQLRFEMLACLGGRAILVPVCPLWWIATVTVGLTLASCGEGDENSASPAQDSLQTAIDRAHRATRASGLEWSSTPTEILEQSTEIASMASHPILCPQIAPRPTDARLGKPHVKPSRARSGTDRSVVGFYFVYVAQPDTDADRGPFIHFTFESARRGDELAGYGADLPDAARRITWGEVRGIWSPPSGDDPAHNHAVFLWRDGDTRYAASLHEIGRATRPALRTLVRSLEPV
jgi:hypothetical protein